MKIDEVIDQHAAYANENSQLIHLSKQGLKWISRQPAAMEALENWERVTGKYNEETARRRREKAESVAAAVALEVNGGFPTLHAHAAVACWSALESCIESILIAWLLDNPDILRVDAISKIKISLADYEVLSSEERMRYILDEIKRSTKAALKVGIGRFEVVLEAFEVKGAVPANLKSTLMQLSQIRNVLVHKAGIADKRLVDSCPGLGIKIGQRVKVNAEMFNTYEVAVPEYVGAVVKRLHERSRSFHGNSDTNSA